MKKILLLLSLFCIVNQAISQSYSSRSKKAIRYFEKALDAYEKHQDEQALHFINLSLEKDKDFIEPYMLRAEIYLDRNNYAGIIESYERVFDISPDFYPFGYFIKANAEFQSGKYEDAKQSVKTFGTYKKYRERYKEPIEQLQKKCEFAIRAKQNPVDFEPVNLGENVNSPYSEYWPSLTADEKILVFTVLLPKNPNDTSYYAEYQEDFFITTKENGQWTPARNLGKPMSTDRNEGAQTISADGSRFAFTSCSRIGESGGCELFISDKEGDVWKAPKKIGSPVNTRFWESQPCLSADGRTIYFVSNRPDGFGGKDIWVSHMDRNNRWSKPENLGDSINTPQNESAPFIHYDGNTLYFSSDGRFGMGGADIFISRKLPDGKWSKPENIGYPINTHNDEIGLIINAKGNTAMFSSDRLGGYGKLDLYRFELAEKFRPTPVTYLKGRVFDDETGEILSADVELIGLQSNEIVNTTYSDPRNGRYLICLPADRKYALNVNKTGYLFYSEHFDLKNLQRGEGNLKPYIKNIPLKPLKVGQSIVLKNIFFETAKHELLPESMPELEKLLAFMQQNPTVKIEISGHTDNEGGKEYNDTLSLQRAKAVYDYLTEHKTDAGRLTYKGYGYSKPISTNETAEGRAKNRRTEFKITAIEE